MDETALVRATQRGERRAFGALVDRYYRNVYRLAYAYTGCYQEADDMCQETFLRAFTRIGELRNGSNFQNWLFSIACNLVRRHIKLTSDKRKRLAEDLALNPGHYERQGSPGPLETLSRKEEAEAVYGRLQQMPDRMRLATILILMQGVSQKDAACMLNCSTASICRELRMAKQRLRGMLENLH